MFVVSSWGRKNSLGLFSAAPTEAETTKDDELDDDDDKSELKEGGMTVVIWHVLIRYVRGILDMGTKGEDHDTEVNEEAELDKVERTADASQAGFVPIWWRNLTTSTGEGGHNSHDSGSDEDDRDVFLTGAIILFQVSDTNHDGGDGESKHTGQSDEDANEDQGAANPGDNPRDDTKHGQRLSHINPDRLFMHFILPFRIHSGVSSPIPVIIKVGSSFRMHIYYKWPLDFTVSIPEFKTICWIPGKKRRENSNTVGLHVNF